MDSLNNIRNNYNSNKITKSNSNLVMGNGNIYSHNNINEYREKTRSNKNKINNNLYKTISFNNETKKPIKKYGTTNYNLNSSKRNNNILIDDTTSNDTDILTENGNNNKETNLYVYRSEVQYPVTNIISNFHLYNNQFKNKNYTSNVLNTDYNNYKSNICLDYNSKLVETVSKSVGNSATKQKNYHKSESVSNYTNQVLSPLESAILSNKRSKQRVINKNNTINSANNSIKLKNRFQTIKEKLSPVLLHFINEKKPNEKLYNNNTKDRITNSCHHFYEKKNISKDKYNNINMNKEKLSNIYINSRKNKINNIFLNNEDENYKHHNRNRTINYQLKSIYKFCDSVEKYLIFILKYYFEYFMNQLKSYKDYQKLYEPENKSQFVIKKN